MASSTLVATVTASTVPMGLFPVLPLPGITTITPTWATGPSTSAPSIRAHPPRAPAIDDPGVGDGDMQGPEALDGGGADTIDCSEIPHVGGDGVHGCTEWRRLFRQRLDVDVRHDA